MSVDKSIKSVPKDWRKNTYSDIPEDHLHPKSESQIKQLCDFYNCNANIWNDMFKTNFGYTKSFDIIKSRIKDLNIKTMLDVGCGSSIPFIQYLKMGYDVKGIDFAQLPLKITAENLAKEGFDPKRVSFGDVTKPETLPKETFDCIISVGVFPHILDVSKSLAALRGILNQKGTMFIQFRNQLFSLFSLNLYSYEFFKNTLIDFEKLGELKKPVDDYLKEHLKTPTINAELNILSRFENPLTIHQTFEKIDMKVKNVFFFHYHAVPPIFEKDHAELFNKLSFALEDPTDWRGNFMASSFIVEAVKI